MSQNPLNTRQAIGYTMAILIQPYQDFFAHKRRAKLSLIFWQRNAWFRWRVRLPLTYDMLHHNVWRVFLESWTSFPQSTRSSMNFNLLPKLQSPPSTRLSCSTKTTRSSMVPLEYREGTGCIMWPCVELFLVREIWKKTIKSKQILKSISLSICPKWTGMDQPAIPEFSTRCLKNLVFSYR